MIPLLTFLIFSLSALNSSSISAASLGSTQSVAVSGTLTCEGKPAVGVRVDLMESDNNGDNSGIVDMDDFMNFTVSDQNGFFKTSGSEVEISGIEPYVNVFHKCSDGLNPCQRVLRINIPKSATTSGSSPLETFSIGTFELAGKLLGELRSCLYRNLTASSP